MPTFRLGMSIRHQLLRKTVGADRLVERLRRGFHHFVGGLVSGSLSDSEVESLSIHVYEEQLAEYSDLDLFDWERKAFTDHLPSPPADILILAAGNGREAVALEKQGYRVHAADPALAGYAALAQQFGDRACQATFDDILLALDGKGLAAGWLPPSVDAAIIGWGGISHLLDPERREELVVRLAHRTKGSLILSVYPGKTDTWSFRMGSRVAGRRQPKRWGYYPLNGFYSRVEESEAHFWGKLSRRELLIGPTRLPRVYVLRPRA